jgi:hypothetical protein
LCNRVQKACAITPRGLPQAVDPLFLPPPLAARRRCPDTMFRFDTRLAD